MEKIWLTQQDVCHNFRLKKISIEKNYGKDDDVYRMNIRG